jgi:ribose 5-phosphate isomerase B
MGARIIGSAMALDLADAFLSAYFSNEERHLRRLQKVKGIEQHEFR